MIKNKIENISCETSLEMAEELFTGKCSINSKRIKVISKALIKLGSAAKIYELIKDEVDELKKLEKMEDDLTTFSTDFVKNIIQNT